MTLALTHLIRCCAGHPMHSSIMHILTIIAKLSSAVQEPALLPHLFRLQASLHSYALAAQPRGKLTPWSGFDQALGFDQGQGLIKP